MTPRSAHPSCLRARRSPAGHQPCVQKPHLIPHPAGAGRNRSSVFHLPGRGRQGVGGAGGTRPVPIPGPINHPPDPEAGHAARQRYTSSFPSLLLPTKPLRLRPFHHPQHPRRGSQPAPSPLTPKRGARPRAQRRTGVVPMGCAPPSRAGRPHPTSQPSTPGNERGFRHPPVHQLLVSTSPLQTFLQKHTPSSLPRNPSSASSVLSRRAFVTSE